tara:strand:+ start:1448 stop:1654 length:207 start_codon:yes stop_codon:yes gene_type:complete
MLIFDYPSKKELKTQIGRTLHYHETSMFGPEYKSTGLLVGCNRPHITGHKREFFASVQMEKGVIQTVK